MPQVLDDCTRLVRNLSALPSDPHNTAQVLILKPKSFKFKIQVLKIMGQTYVSLFSFYVIHDFESFFKVSFLPFRFSLQKSRLKMHFLRIEWLTCCHLSPAAGAKER